MWLNDYNGEAMFTIIKFIEVVITSILIIDFIKTLYKNKVIINVRWCAYYVFQVIFIIPNLIMLLYGKLNLYSYGYKFIVNNWQVEIIYSIFIIFTYCMLKREAKKTKNSFEFNNISNLKIKIPAMVILIAFAGTFVPLIMVLLSPQPYLYFRYFAIFERTDMINIVSSEARKWHNGELNISLFVGMISCVILWVGSLNMKLDSRIILRLYLFIVGMEILLFSSKRTLGIFLFIIYLIADFLLKKKRPWIEFAFIVLGCISYFIFYQSIVNKTIGGGVSSPVEMYIVYFSRILDYRFISYSLLHPSQVKILQYPCQSFLFDILPFIKRTNWVNKPYPFGVYYTAAWTNTIVNSVNYRYTVSWFGEALANLSWIGLPVGYFLYSKMLSVFEKIKNPIVNIFSIYVAIYFMVTHVQSNYYNIIILALLYILIEKRLFARIFKK